MIGQIQIPRRPLTANKLTFPLMRHFVSIPVHIPVAPRHSLIRNPVPPDLFPTVAPHAFKASILQHADHIAVYHPGTCNFRRRPRKSFLQDAPFFLQHCFQFRFGFVRITVIIRAFQNHIVPVFLMPSANAVA
ncbi:hypothetical protein D3C85_1150730 [compost metagenome]